jgi:hypothetical protein
MVFFSALGCLVRAAAANEEARNNPTGPIRAGGQGQRHRHNVPKKRPPEVALLLEPPGPH